MAGILGEGKKQGSGLESRDGAQSDRDRKGQFALS